MLSQDDVVKKLGLSEMSMPFYSVMADNHSAMGLMNKDKFRKIAVVLIETIYNNAFINREIKENVRAKMPVAIRRLAVC